MKGFLKSALSPFVEITEEETPKARATSVPSVSTPTQPVQISSVDVDKFAQHFDQLLQDSNLPGPDYYEFNKVQETLTVHIADPKARMAAAYASLCVQGLTKAKLVESAQVYVGIIEKDKAGFEAALSTKLQAEVDSRKTQILGLQKTVDEASKQIQQLTKQITDSQISIQKLNEEATEAQLKIQKSQGAFVAACDAIVQKIKGDITQIQTGL